MSPEASHGTAMAARGGDGVIDDLLRSVDRDPVLREDLAGLAASGLLYAASALRRIGVRVEIGADAILRADSSTGHPGCALLLPGGPAGLLREDAGELTGPGIASAWGPMAACIAALRAARTHGVAPGAHPVLLIGGAGLSALADAAPPGVDLVRFDGAAAPRLWPGCFGSFDILVRVRGRKTSLVEPNLGVNAIEEAIPLLVELRALGRRIVARRIALPSPDPALPLSGRLTVAAVHGGQQGTVLPTVCDVLMNRRYLPTERFDAAVAELHEAVDAGIAASAAVGVDTMISNHRPPVGEPHAGYRPRSLAALARGYGWPHDPVGFADDPENERPMVRLGGLMQPGGEPGTTETTSLPALRALARSVVAYLMEPSPPSD